MVLRVTWLQSGCKVHRISSSDQPDQPVGSVCRISPLDFPTPAAFLASQYCDMLETMYVRCTHCGYDNSPEYRFCGMCGASLAHPPAPVKTPEKPVAANGGNGGNGSSEKVHGPSFLGLAEDPK